MNGQAPDVIGDTTNSDIVLPENSDVAVITIPLEEWNAHKARVEALVNLVNGVINGLASNPLFMSMVPPDVLSQMQGKI